MSNASKQSRPLFWFYILVGYVLVQFVWWAYLMVSLNGEVNSLQNQINLLNGNSAEEVIKLGNELNDKLHKRWLMISGEGAVFIALLLVGIVQVRKSFKREQKLTEQEKNFLLSVTHELKSPIASSKLQLQTLLKHNLEKEQQQKMLNNAIEDTNRLNNLVENILLAAKVENPNYMLQKEKCNISQITKDVVGKLKNTYDAKANISLTVEPDIYLNVDKSYFPSIVLNLVENAMKYAPEDSSINLTLRKSANNVICNVIDEGVGISDAEKKNVFNRFYRVGNEETRSAKGTGLGLFIVDQLVKQHNGSIVIKDNQPRGCNFEITFRA